MCLDIPAWNVLQLYERCLKFRSFLSSFTENSSYDQFAVFGSVLAMLRFSDQYRLPFLSFKHFEISQYFCLATSYVKILVKNFSISGFLGFDPITDCSIHPWMILVK